MTLELTTVITIPGLYDHVLSFFNIFDALSLFHTAKVIASNSTSKNHLKSWDYLIIRDVYWCLKKRNLKELANPSLSIHTYPCLSQCELDFFDFAEYVFEEAHRKKDFGMAKSIIRCLLNNTSTLSSVMIATMIGNISGLKFLVRIGANVEYGGNGAPSPLNLMCRRAHPYFEMIKVLVDAGANVNSSGNPLESLLEVMHLCSDSESYKESEDFEEALECVKLLIKAGAETRTLEPKLKLLLQSLTL